MKYRSPYLTYLRRKQHFPRNRLYRTPQAMAGLRIGEAPGKSRQWFSQRSSE